MFKQNNISSENKKTNSDIYISGTYTNESYNLYSSISDRQKKTFKNSKAFAILIISLIAISSIMFAFSIKNAFFKEEEAVSTDTPETVKSIKTDEDFNSDIKVENITDEISALYNIPVGIKIVSVNSIDNEYLNGLRTNDIIVNISGTDVKSFDEATSIINSLQNEGMMISYTVYRNGVYKEIYPYE